MTVYFVGDGRGHVKIGHAKYSVQSRLAGLQTGSALKLTLLGQIEGGPDVEKALHVQLSKHRVSGEWFHLNEETRAAMVSIPPMASESPVVNKVIISTKLSRELVEELDDCCVRTHHNRSQILELAVRSWLRLESEPARKRSRKV
jgi:hypothetical protein